MSPSPAWATCCRKLTKLKESLRLGADYNLVQEVPAKAAQTFLDFILYLEVKYPDRNWLPDRVKSWLSQPFDPSRPLTTILAQGPSQVFGAHIGEEIVGQESRGFHGHFRIVDPEFQNQGIGTTLLDDLKSQYDYIEIDVLHGIGTKPGDPDLNQFYLNRGFRRTMDDSSRMVWRRSKS